MKNSRVVILLPCAAALFTLSTMEMPAQPPAGFGKGAAKGARPGALIDITGQWVSVVNEDWRWRMVTPAKDDVSSVPVSAAGRRIAGTWNLAADRTSGQLCKAFGAPALIRQPGRIRIEWEGDNTLKLDFDAGTQTRLFHFGNAPAQGPPSLQGHSTASWFKQPQSRGIFGRGGAAGGGSLAVVTTNLVPGYIRPNGVPYSDKTTLKEYIDTFTLPEDGSWLIVTTVINDPEYLTQEFVLSTQFKKETDASKWSPRPCEIPDPIEPRAKAK